MFPEFREPVRNHNQVGRNKTPVPRKAKQMKLNRFAHVFVIGLTLTLAAAGCRKGPGMVTNIHGSKFGPVEVPKGDSSGKIADATNPADSVGGVSGIPANDPTSHANWKEDAEIFKANTVHFAFDSSVVKESDKSNLAAVASHLKSNLAAAVKVEGHCDERGTAEYNRSLGERRAQAIRTELVSRGTTLAERAIVFC